MPEFEPDDSTQVKTASTMLVVPNAPFAVGDRVSGRYLLQESIGEGGFGAVFRARDEMLGREVALKTLHPRRGDSEALLAEARVIARLDHSNIVPVYDVGAERNVAWMAMKLIDGEGLDRILERDGRMTSDRVVRIIGQVAQALDHAHRRSIVHRDVKPSNILISRGEDGEHVWLADFGIATMMSADTATHETLIAGTPRYMAPEQITGKRVDARTDIFALGCVIAEAITGQRCFDANSVPDLIYRIVHEQPAALATVGQLAGDGFEAVVRRALAKSPEDRFQTAEELRRQLLQPGARAPRPSILKRFRRETVWDGHDVIVTRDLRKGYGWRSPVVRGVSFAVPRGAIYALLGRNGSGKTTLLRTLLGLYRRDGGDVLIFGRDPQRHGAEIMARVGFVPETLPAYDSLRVRELFELLSRAYAGWDRGFSYTLLGKFRLPLETRVRALSRGMRTQLALVGALAHRPDLLVLDDPTLGLDAVVLDDFFETLADTSRREGTTVLMASHNIAEMETIASHVGLFANGRLVLADTLAGLRARTREVTATFAGDVPQAVRGIVDFKTIRSSDRHVTGFVLDESSGAIERLRALHPTELKVRELSLKEIFVNFMRDS